MASGKTAPSRVLSIRSGILVDGVPTSYHLHFDRKLSRTEKEGVLRRFVELNVPVRVSASFRRGKLGTVCGVGVPDDKIGYSRALLGRLRDLFEPKLPYTASTDAVVCSCDECQGVYWLLVTFHNELSWDEQTLLLLQFTARAAGRQALWLPRTPDGPQCLSVKIPVSPARRRKVFNWFDEAVTALGIAGTTNEQGHAEFLAGFESIH